MYGAIIGDIVGSRFEFDRTGIPKDFDLFAEECRWTDDTVMTVAVADALMKEGPDASVTSIESHVRHSLRKWGRKYPNAGYGGSFRRWLYTKGAGPYNSYGNGSAMRVSAAGWLYDSLDRTREVARATAAVTHDHPEGLKGAECTAAVIHMARNGSAKDEIREYVSREFGYNVTQTLEHAKLSREHPVSCQDSLPKALAAFFEGDSYEDVIRKAVSLGGDTDTLAAIAGSMAEAFYGIPVSLEIECFNRLPEDMQEVLRRFDDIVKAASEADDPMLKDNVFIEKGIELFYYLYNQESLAALLTVIRKRIEDDGECLVGYDVVKGDIAKEILTKKMGEAFQFDSDVILRTKILTDQNGGHPVYYMVTGKDQTIGAEVVMNVKIRKMIELALNDDQVEELVINPFGQHLRLTKEIMKIILESDRQG